MDETIQHLCSLLNKVALVRILFQLIIWTDSARRARLPKAYTSGVLLIRTFSQQAKVMPSEKPQPQKYFQEVRAEKKGWDISLHLILYALL